jgi:hypothetical protein
MAQKITVENVNEQDRHRYCRELEEGNILFFPSLPFTFPQEEIDFLLSQRQGGGKKRKNIAYKPQLDKVTNNVSQNPEIEERLKLILRQFSKRASLFLGELLSPYSKEWILDYASFRPFQEKGRNLRLRARNDLLHVDAFPTRPLHGKRILRFFVNINPTESRHWITSEPFEELAKKYGGRELSFPKPVGHSFLDIVERKIKRLFRASGLKMALRSPYDTFMLRLHNFLKENRKFQENCPKNHWEFPPNCCWAVFTDQVSHAALSGQYALEQTFLVPTKALLFPERSPISVLERLAGAPMLDPDL